MLSPEQFGAFLLAAFLISLAPGPDNLMVLGVGMARGRRYGIAFGLGCAVGCLSHTALAVLGVSALLAASPLAFALLKTGGGLYLLWLGIQAWRHAGGAPRAADGTRETPGQLFRRGMLANAVNPKVALFFLAFLPQFVLPGQGGVAWQMAALGLVFALQAALVFALLGHFAGAAGQRLQRQPRLGRWLDRLAGALFVGLGLRLIVSR